MSKLSTMRGDGITAGKGSNIRLEGGYRQNSPLQTVIGAGGHRKTTAFATVEHDEGAGADEQQKKENEDPVLCVRRQPQLRLCFVHGTPH